MQVQIQNHHSAFDINKFDKSHNYVIEASAGTGKTYTIVEIIKKLLSEDVTLDKMLIVTYTEKAAGELKDRIRKVFSEISEPLKDKQGNDVDNASIGTIHAFCQNTINEFFISAGKPSSQKLIDESEIKDFLKRFMRRGKIYQEICEYKKTNTDEKIEDKLINKIYAFVDKYYLNTNGSTESEIAVFDEFDTSILNKNLFYKPEIQDAISILLSSTDDKVKDFAQYLFDNQSVDYSKYTYHGKGFTKSSCKTPEEKEAFEIIKGLKFKDYIDKQDEAKNDICNTVICKYINDIYLSWQKEKENLCEQTYNDMIRNVREEVVNNGPLLNKIKEKYTYAIIDEFQDTNQKQWDIFKTVFLSDDQHHIVVVGDPKQSIYAFQGADVTVYNKAKIEIGEQGGIICSLKKNFRATSNIIKSTNDFFKFRNALPGDIAFIESEVGVDNFKVEYEGNDISAFWITEKEVTPEEYAKIVCNRIVDFCTKINGETKLRVYDKKGISRNVSFKDFAVLARTRSEMIPIQNAFEKCGIPYTQYKDKNLFSGKECADWIALFEAIKVSDFTGSNRSFFRKAMVTYFFGYSVNDVPSPHFDTDKIDEIGFFTKWRDIVAKRDWTKLIEKILVDTDVFEKLRGHGDLKTFGIIMQIGDYCSEYLSRTDNLDMLIRNLRKQSLSENDEGENDDSGTVAISTDLDFVQVMTIHASKGLEFPVVISVAGFKRENSYAAQINTYHADDKNYLSFVKNELVKQENIDEYRRLFYVAYTRAKYLLMLPHYSDIGVNEFVRRTILNFKEKDYYNHMSSDNLISYENLKISVAEILKKTDDECGCGEDDLNERKEKLKKFGDSIYFHTSQKHAYSSLSYGIDKNMGSAINQNDGAKLDTERIENDLLKHNDNEDKENPGLSEFDKNAKVIACDYDKSKEPIILSPNFIAGTGLGNALHKVFEIIDYKNQNSDIDDLIKNCFAGEKIRCKDEWVNDVKNMVNNVLNAKFPIIHGSEFVNDVFLLKELAISDRKNEVEFNFDIPKNNNTHHYMNGFVDLIFKRGEYYSILDWKSDRLNDDFISYNNSDNLKKHCDEHYSIQRVLYSYCLVKWLKQFYNESEEEIFNKHFGGIYYVFLRGCNTYTGNGIYAQTWNNFADLENAYNKIIDERVH